MSAIPTPRQIHEGAATITLAFEQRIADPAAHGEDGFWTTGPWAAWKRLAPDEERVRAGDGEAIEHAIVYLEADPWCFRSGYQKERLFRLLARHELAPDQQARMDAVVLRLTQTGRREFLEALRYVRRRRGPGLKPALRQLLSSPDDAVATRALRMLLAARRPRLDPEAREHALRALRSRTTRQHGMSKDELRRAIEAIWGPAPTWRTDDTTT